jgi:hypothetical protein
MPGSIIVAAIMEVAVVEFTIGMTVAAFAINMVASSIISKAFGPQAPNVNDATQNPGNRMQIPPAGDNKVPVVYGSAYLGGIITDLSITSDNQKMFYVLTLAEVTNTETGGTPDTYTFGDVYWGGKKCVFDTGSNSEKVIGLLDESTGITDTTVAGKMNIYLFRNGSSSGVNTSLTAIQIMQTSGLVYTWDSTKLMSNVAFAIIELTYNSEANITGIQQTKFQITNSRYKPGDCFSDYWQSARYGAGLSLSEINTTSLAALNAYCDETFTYTPYSGGSATQTRFRFDGVLDTNNTIMTNMQSMASCCDCLIKYNEISGQWGVIVQKPSYTVSMAIDNSNMVSAIQVSPIDLASSYNIAEVKFPDSTAQDSFNSATFDLAVIDPSLLYPNEPINKQTISLPLVNNSVRSQYLANRFLESAREDLQIKVDVDFSGIQLEAGDIVTMTNPSYGWVAKLFRVSQITEKFGDDGTITASLTLMEFNPEVYDDKNITQFTPSPNTGIGSPLGFGTLYAPSVTNVQASAPVPSFDVAVTAASNGIVQYAEVYYSAYASPTESQRFFAGTTAVNPGGNPYTPSASMGVVTIGGIPQGDWYFAVKYVNSLGSSDFSASSAVFQWRPYTFQFSQRYLSVAYADDISGGGFSLSPTSKEFFGLLNQSDTTISTSPSAYTWYDANPDFALDNFLLFASRQNRKFTFASGGAVYASQTGTYVPSDTTTYDQSLWSALPDGTNIIDLDARTGQLIRVGTSAISSSDGLIKVVNNQTGQIIAQLDRFLNFGDGVNQKTFPVSALTIDVFGRVVGVVDPDEFFFTSSVFAAAAGQTSFSVTHVVGQVLVFKNGILLSSSDYTETTSTVVLNVACSLNDRITILNMRATSTLAYYEPLNITVASVSSSTVTYSSSSSPYQYINAGDKVTFVNAGTPTQYTVSTVNYTTRQITFATSPTGIVTGTPLYRYRNAATSYTPFSRQDISLSGVSSYTPTEWSFRSGFELIFINGSILNEIDYDLTSGTLSGLPDLTSGIMSVIQFSENSFSVPCSAVTNTLTTTTTGQNVYSFDHNADAFELYANGALLTDGVDFTENPTTFTLASTPTNSYTILQQQTFARAGAA